MFTTFQIAAYALKGRVQTEFTKMMSEQRTDLLSGTISTFSNAGIGMACFWPFASILKMESRATLTWLNSAESSEKTTSVIYPSSTSGYQPEPPRPRCVTCLEELGEDISHPESVLHRGEPWQLFNGLPSDLKRGETHTRIWPRCGTRILKFFRHQEVDHATHRHVLVLTQVQLGVDGSVCHVWETAEELGDELSRQALFLGAALDTI